MEARVENSARVYNLVLGHCPPELRAEMQNHSSWTSSATAQDCIVLLVMIRDLTHNTKETKQGTMALVECHSVELVAPSWTQPAKPVRIYYVTPKIANPMTNPMTQTPRRFQGNSTTLFRSILPFLR